ncbi:MAG: segregation/condensation protein A [Firmicutes bacterium]|nr:segregation/condensation protein A [Bacillota bacterium]
MEDILIKTESFEGPLDLLLALIEKNKLDIYDIPIALVADQYLSCVHAMERTGAYLMEELSRFLLMAATLLELKARMLLPKREEEAEEEDPREELVQKLLEYKKFKELAGILGEKAEEVQSFYREDDSALSLFRASLGISTPEEFLEGLTADELFAAFSEVMKKQKRRKASSAKAGEPIKRDTYTVEQKMSYLRDLLFLYNRVEFFGIFSPDAEREELIVTFLALLELIKLREIKVVQKVDFGKILLIKTGDKNEAQ